MYSLISVGISEYNKQALSSIPCAINDTLSIYNVFKRVLKDDFCEYSSIVINNINSDKLISALNTIKTCLGDKDTLVIYFSGHGKNNQDGTLTLCLKDNEEISFNIITAIFSNVRFNVIIILDCCYSGLALKEAENGNNIQEKRLHIMTSSDKVSTSKCSSDMSEFTKNLCETLLYLDEAMQDITFTVIQGNMKKKGIECYINEPTTTKPIKIRTDYSEVHIEDIIAKFKKQINTKDIAKKEMLIYAIEGHPAKFKLDLLESVWDIIENEASWLVRRALGSVLGNCIDINNKKNTLIEKGITSKNWMIKATILICIRYDIEQYKEEVIEIINNKSEVMDVVWLASLYYTDKYNSIEVIDILLNSNLGKTEWGILEIFCRLIKSNEPQLVYERIIEKVSDDKLLVALKKEIILNKNWLNHKFCGMTDF